MDIDPPFEETYKSLLHKFPTEAKDNHFNVEECELPLIDLNFLALGSSKREKCTKDICKAASEWGFFQVVNHGVPQRVLDLMLNEQRKVLHQPFNKKTEVNFLNLSANSYRWGNSKATRLRQFSWSEAFHIPLTDIQKMPKQTTLRTTIEAFARTLATLAQKLAEILARNIGDKTTFIKDNCLPSTSYVRMNRYPPCPFTSEVFGLMPHTDSNFLTIVYEDQIGGLQLMKNGRWSGVKPNPEALLINIGDLFQAYSNDFYKSIEHRVVAQRVERFSIAYFYCPSYNTVVESCIKPAIYRKFSFGEYKQQIQMDVEATGSKVGLTRFLL